MSNDNPQVTDKRRFADRINDEDVKQMIREDREEVRSMLQDDDVPYDPTQEDSPAMYGTFGRKLNTEFSPSSNPSQTPGMDFPTAMKQVIKGLRVTRLEWENPEIWLMMFYWGQISPKQPAGKYLSIHHADGAVNPLVIGDGDLFGDDWVVVV